MNENQIEIYEIFVAKCTLHNIKYDDENYNIKKLVLDSTIDELILKYDTMINYTEIFDVNEDLFLSAFYESVSNYIMNNNFDSITNAKYVLPIFPYLSQTTMYELTIYLYLNSSPDIQEYFNYELINILYAIMINKEMIDCNSYYELISKLFNNAIIKNPLHSTKEEQKQEDYKLISLFDMFVHSSYVLEKYNVSIIFLRLIIDQMEKLDVAKFINFHNTSVNMNSLYTLYENINSNNYEYIENIGDIEKDTNIYANKPMYFINKMYTYMKTKKILSKYKVDGKNTIYYLEYYYENILTKDKNYYFVMDNNFIPDESVYIIGDLFRINNNGFYKLFIDSFNKSTNISKSTKVFMLTIWLRYIYYIINKCTRDPVTCDIKTNTYYINKKEISRINYINDIVLYLNYIKDSLPYVHEFLIENIKQFVLVDYDEMITKCNSREDKTCSICLDNVDNISNMNICLQCNNLFHDSCINQVCRHGHNYCPLCRKNINSCFYTYLTVRYEFMKDILDRYKE